MKVIRVKKIVNTRQTLSSIPNNGGGAERGRGGDSQILWLIGTYCKARCKSTCHMITAIQDTNIKSVLFQLLITTSICIFFVPKISCNFSM